MKISELEENAALVGKLMQAFAQNMARRAGTAAGAAERVLPKAAGAERAAVKAAPQAERLISDQLADRAIAAGVRLEPISAKVQPTTGGLFKDQVVRIVNYQDRAIVVVKVDGVRVPFYCSSGNVAKEGVKPGRWYPIFGIGPDGWINKGTEKGISQYYGMPNLRATAQALDASLGDIRSAMEKGGFKHFGGGHQAIADINQGLNPVSKDQGFEAFKKNAYSLLRRLGAAV